MLPASLPLSLVPIKFWSAPTGYCTGCSDSRGVATGGEERATEGIAVVDGCLPRAESSGLAVPRAEMPAILGVDEILGVVGILASTNLVTAGTIWGMAGCGAEVAPMPPREST